MASLVDAITVAGRTAPSRVIFGPHETNLGDDRAISHRHVAYYQARAAGGSGIIVTETASVHPSDWPYERAPLATECGPGWAATAAACHPHGTLVMAGLGHAGGQGSSAYSQSVMWAPSPVADAINREMPMEMEQDEMDQLVAGFAHAARLATASGLDGVEIDIGPFSLLRQFHSGLTNLRDDGYGTDRLRLTVEVVAAVRHAIGDDHLVSIRLCCDELAPWAGVTPDHAADHVAALADQVDLVVVVRGGPFSGSAYRPDGHTPATFNADLCRRMRGSAEGRVPVVLQGSVIDPGVAQAALDDATADLVEMTRAQIADPRLVTLFRNGAAQRIRPCILCNQACHVRDNRNPIVSCVGEPRSGHETSDPDIGGTDPVAGDVLVVGGGVAGLECARVLAGRGHRVRLVERDRQLGGSARTAAVSRSEAVSSVPRSTFTPDTRHSPARAPRWSSPPAPGRCRSRFPSTKPSPSSMWPRCWREARTGSRSAGWWSTIRWVDLSPSARPNGWRARGARWRSSPPIRSSAPSWRSPEIWPMPIPGCNAPG